METATKILPAFAARPAESSASRDAALAALVDDYLARLQAGEEVNPDAFAAEHPEHAERLGRLLPALELMDDMRRSSSSLGHNHSLTPVLMQSPGVAPGLVGDFQIVREVGRGGMGVVYEARQLSLNRRVALKVLPLAAAMDPRQLERFHVEAQAAACLHHTNIVPIHAVGCERGVHFYAMQFIEGQTLAAIVGELRVRGGLDGVRPPGDRSALSTLVIRLANGELAPEKPGPQAAVVPPAGATLEPPVTPSSPPAVPGNPASQSLSSTSTHSRALFRTAARLGIQAAEAIEHAHGLGVIHRDIKPANLLVDDRGNLWITDFGLARLQNDSGLTLTGDLMGTLRYMSPEQATGRGIGVDHRTDIYSLGVTLYELLTMRPACPGDDRQTVLRQVAEEEPISLRRHNPAIPRELETIVLKAIAKDAGSRYATAQELADDLRRFLDDKPIKAKRPTAWEHAVKWSRRHKALVRALMVGLCLSVVGLSVATWLTSSAYRREAHQRLLAETQRLRAEANYQRAREAVDKLLTEVGQSSLKDIPQMEPVRRRLLESALDFYQGFLLQKGEDPALRHEIGRTYDRVAEIQMLLGRYDQAQEAARGAVNVLDRLGGEFPAADSYRVSLGVALSRLGHVLTDKGAFPEAERVNRRSVEVLSPLGTGPAAHAEARHELGAAHRGLGVMLLRSGRLAEAEPELRRALAIDEQIVAEQPDNADLHSKLGGDLSNLAVLLNQRGGSAAEARLLLERAIEHQQAALRADPKDLKRRDYLRNHVTNLIWTLVRLGDHPGALENSRRALALSQELARDFPSVADFRHSVAVDHFNLGNVLREAGKGDEAEQAYRRSLELFEALVKEFPDAYYMRDYMPDCHSSLASLLEEQGRFLEALPLRRRALDLNRQLAEQSPEDPGVQTRLAETRAELVWLLTIDLGPMHRDPAEALRLAEQAIAQDPDQNRSHQILAAARYRAGDSAGAIAAMNKSLELEPRETGDLLWLALAYFQLGEKERARSFYDRAAAWIKGNAPVDRLVARLRGEAAALLRVTNQADPTAMKEENRARSSKP